MDIKALYDIFLKNGTVSTDSRNIIPGCIFFALKGENFNGNQYAAEAINKGAIAAVVDEDMPVANDKIFRVGNVLSSLQHLSSYHRRQTGVTVLAITGSNGKTTTKELCRAVLSRKFNVYATEGNLNNHIGVPLTLLSIKSDVEIAIVEMGANHPGEIEALCNIAEPDYGLITNIGKAHLEGFGGIYGVARAKGEMFDHLMKHGKTLFLNEGNSYLLPLVPGNYPKVVRYNGDTSLKALNLSSNPLMYIRAGSGDVDMEINTNLTGNYNAENVLAAVSVGLHFELQSREIVEAIETYQPRNNRSQLIKTARNTVFMDAYNANPSSMQAAINEFLHFNSPDKLLILGEMREVGDSSGQEHDEIVTLLKKSNAVHVICVGRAFEYSAKTAGYQYAENVDELNRMLENAPLNGFYILVKGSRSNHLEKVLPLL